MAVFSSLGKAILDMVVYLRNGMITVIFQGGFAPFIVRRHEETRTFKLVSEGYIHGLMKGEVTPMVHAKEFDIEEIVLS